MKVDCDEKPPCDIVQCLRNPCDDAKCPAHPDATCEPNYCGTHTLVLPLTLTTPTLLLLLLLLLYSNSSPNSSPNLTRILTPKPLSTTLRSSDAALPPRLGSP